jgi:hypothetical protein
MSNENLRGLSRSIVADEIPVIRLARPQRKALGSLLKAYR